MAGWENGERGEDKQLQLLLIERVETLELLAFDPPGDTNNHSNTHRRRKDLIKEGKKRQTRERWKKEEKAAEAK